MFENIAVNTPSNTPNYSTGGNYGTNWLSSIVGALGKAVERNPQQLAITADMIGSRLAPNNPFAGVGTYLGKSSLANKAAEGTTKKMELLDQIINSLSAKNMPGGNSVSITTGADGKPVMKFETNLGDLSGETKTPDESPYGVLSSFLSK